MRFSLRIYEFNHGLLGIDPYKLESGIVTAGRQGEGEKGEAMMGWWGVEVARFLGFARGLATEGTMCLMLRLIYGAGLRQMECLRLRVQDVDLDLDLDVLMVREGKGGKDRRVMMPQANGLEKTSIVNRLAEQAAALGRKGGGFANDLRVFSSGDDGRKPGWRVGVR